MDGKRGGKAPRGGKGKKKNENVWDDAALQRAYQRGISSFQKSHGATNVEEFEEPAPVAKPTSETQPAAAVVDADDMEEGELSDEIEVPPKAVKDNTEKHPAASRSDAAAAAATAESVESKVERTPKRKRSQKSLASPDGSIDMDEQQRIDAWRQYYESMGYYHPHQQHMGLPSPAPAPVFRTPTQPARRVTHRAAARASPQTPVGVPKPQIGKQKTPTDDDTGYDDDEEEEVASGDEGDDDSSDGGYESEEESNDDYPHHHGRFQSPGFNPWSPSGSFIPPPSPLFPGLSTFPSMIPNFGYAPPASPGYNPMYMAPPSPVADMGNMVWSAFYAGFMAGQHAAGSTPRGTPRGTPRSTPKPASKRRKIE